MFSWLACVWVPSDRMCHGNDSMKCEFRYAYNTLHSVTDSCRSTTRGSLVVWMRRLNSFYFLQEFAATTHILFCSCWSRAELVFFKGKHWSAALQSLSLSAVTLDVFHPSVSSAISSGYDEKKWQNRLWLHDANFTILYLIPDAST